MFCTITVFFSNSGLLIIGSSFNKSVLAGKPKAVVICAGVMPADIKVVRGEATLAPAGALSKPTNGPPGVTVPSALVMSIFRPPLTKMP